MLKLRFFAKLLPFYQLTKNVNALIERAPYAAELSKRAKDWSFQLVEIVMKHVATLDKVGAAWLDS